MVQLTCDCVLASVRVQVGRLEADGQLCVCSGVVLRLTSRRRKTGLSSLWVAGGDHGGIG